MNIKQITLAISLIISNPLVMGASYEILDKQQNDLLMPPQESNLGSSYFNLETLDQQQTTLKKQDFLDTLTLIQRNQLDDAANKINSLIEQSPKEPEFLNILALIESLRKNNDLAIQNFQKSLKLDPVNQKAHLGLAMIYLKTGKLAQAKEQANATLTINDKAIDAYFLLADIATREKQNQNVENLLLTAQRKNRGNIRPELTVDRNLLKLYAKQKKPDKTLLLALDLISRYPDNNEALSFLADAQLINHKEQRAIQTLEKIIQHNEKDIRHRFMLANLLTKQPENQKQVFNLLDEIATIAPNDPRTLIPKAAILAKLEHYQEALQLIEKVKQLSPKSGLGEFIEGNIYLTEKKLNQALSAYQKSYSLKPNDKVLNVIVNIMVDQGKQSNAIDFLNTVLQKNPQNLTAHFKLASIYEQQKNINETEKHYKAILEKQPNNVLILNNLAWLYYQQNNPEALSLAETAYQKAPKSAAVMDTYGSILVKQGRLAEGIKILEKASQLMPEGYDAQYHLANAYVLNGELEQASKILNTLVKSEQNFSEKNAAIALLKTLEKN